MAELLEAYIAAFGPQRPDLFKALMAKVRQAADAGNFDEAAAVLRRVIFPTTDNSSAQVLIRLREKLRSKTAARCQIKLAVLLPVGSSEANLPFERTYVEEMSAVCAAKQVPLQNWSRLLPDDELQDTSHSNVFGAEKLQPAFVEIAMPFLRSTHALP